MTISTSLVLADNAYGTLGSALATGDTTLTFTTGHGARFPTVSSGQMLSCCILNANNILEEVQITLHTAGADTATMVRAANGTTAKAWNAGDRIEARVSSDVLKRLQVEALKEITLSTADAGATYTGSISPTGYGLVTGLVYTLKASTSNSGATPTINLSSLGAITVVLDGGVALIASQMPINGLYKFDGTNLILLNPKFLKQPTRTVIGSGSGTYTTPSGATRILVRAIGAGAGGGGSGSGSPGAGTAGGNTTFGTLTANGGAQSSPAGTTSSSAGGTASGGDLNFAGAAGMPGGNTANVPGCPGAGTPFGGGGPGGIPGGPGFAAPANTGAGGGAAGAPGAASGAGGTGAAGGYVEKLFTSPSATYSYGVGAKGTGGLAGTSGFAGGDGGSGVIDVLEYYD